jgi:glycosyltransferase involved in cell wall biosynthesis
MKKVLFLIDSLTCGGAEKSLISLLPLLDYSKVQVDLMMVHRGGVFEQYVPREVNVIDFPQSDGILFRLCQLYFSLLLRLRKSCHGAELRWKAMHSVYQGIEKEYDVAVAYQQGFPTYYIVQKVRAKRKYAWINADIAKAGYQEGYNKEFYDKYDKIVPVSDTLCSMLKNTHFVDVNKLSTVYDILNVDLIRNMAKEQVEMTAAANVVKIVTTGRLAPPKNYSLAVKTALVLKNRGGRFVWYFVGEGSERVNIENLIKQYSLQDEIKMVGMTPNPYPYMAMADVYVQTSSFEGFGLTLNEARILHRPVVTTNFPVAFDQIKDGENGLIAEMTPESVAEKIMLILNDVSLREKLIEGTKKEVNKTAQTEPEKVMRLLMA